MTRYRLGALLLVLVLATWAPVASPGPKTLKIAMVLWRGETDAEKGFRDGLKEHGHAAQYVVMNAGQDRGELGRLLREDLKPGLETFDYIYAYGTTVALAVKTIVQDRVPVIFNIVADPGGRASCGARRGPAATSPASPTQCR